MAAKPSLRAVTEDDAPPRKLRVAEAAETGDRRQLLVAMRARVAKTVEDPNCPPRDLAALTRRLIEIAKEIEALDISAAEEATERDHAADEAFDASAV